jgi:hypothetical protein
MPILADPLCLELLNKHYRSTQAKHSMQATYPVRYGGAVITTSSAPGTRRLPGR